MEQVLHTAATDIDQLSAQELLALFKSLTAPALAEMQGEYRARLLQQPSRLATAAGSLLSTAFLPRWQCKAFRPVDATTGRGYNRFEFQGRSLCAFPMQTLIAPSRYDGRPAFQLVYGHFRSLCGSLHVVDEVRRLGDGCFLGIGTWGFTAAWRQVPLPFLLEGPVAPYQADIGTERAGFRLEDEVPALRRQ